MGTCWYMVLSGYVGIPDEGSILTTRGFDVRL